MYVFMYGGHACECWYMNMDIHVEARSQSHVSGAIYLVAIILQFLSWPGTHKLGKASWPGTLEDLHFSASPAQELRGCTAMPDFLCGIWRLSSGPHASMASTLLTAPSAQPFSWAPHTCQPHLRCRWQSRSQWAKLHRCPRASGEDMEVVYRSTQLPSEWVGTWTAQGRQRQSSSRSRCQAKSSIGQDPAWAG